MAGSAFGIGTPMTQPNLPSVPWGTQLYGQPLSFAPYGLQQPIALQQIAQLLQVVPQQLQHLQQLQYVQLQQIQQLLQVIPAQLAHIQQLIQFVPQQIQQQGQPFQQSFAQAGAGGGLGLASPSAFGSSVFGQSGHLM